MFNVVNTQGRHEALKAFNELKLGRESKFVIYKLNDAKTQIVVDKVSNDQSYDAFTEQLPENDCRYAVYIFEYEVAPGEGKRSKLIFYQWSPDTASVRSKMVYASSKDALKRALNGVATEIQGTDFSEVTYETVLDHLLSRGFR
ncbi:unnamed protein product [Ambrosiozyma monospora]|uniref:Unnamed protein product n=1 Tax=Ambrosiozyma monospora TaxID=43982 RepID=A0ACB5T3A8_AMBMO|nr:unnamed protein product [Ambrosiozyma monospora]